MGTIKNRLAVLSGLLLISSCILIFITGRNILTIDFFHRNGEYMASHPGDELDTYHQLQGWIYLSQIIYLTVKVMLIAMTIYTALYLCNFKCRLRDITLCVVECEFIFLIAAVIKLVTFPLIYSHGTLTDWQKFHPLSALWLVNDADSRLYYLLQVLNIFEAVYWFALGYRLSTVLLIPYDRAMKIVVSSYVPTLAVWTMVVTFYSLVIFPSQI